MSVPIGVGMTEPMAANKQLVRDFLVAFSAGDIDGCMSMCRDDYVWQGSDPAEIGVASGKPAFREAVSSFKRALPDCTVDILDMVAEDDKVAVRFREHGHHTGEAWLGVEAAGAFVEWYPFAIYRIQDGLLAEEWFTDDPYTIKKCLGIKVIE
jgi:ketosteroid isomerase-like protein